MKSCTFPKKALWGFRKFSKKAPRLIFQQGYISKTRSNFPGCSSEKLYFKPCSKSTGEQTSCKRVTSRSSRPEVFVKIFTKPTEKYLRWSPYFNKVASCRAPTCNFVKEKTPAQLFSCGIVKFLRPHFYRTPPGRLLLYINKCELKTYRPIILCGRCIFTKSFFEKYL